MRALLLGVLLAAAAPARAQDSGADQWDARVTAATGEVVVYPADGSPEVTGDVDMPLVQGDRVVTSADSTAEIALDGGSLIALSPNSDFTLENTRKSASIFSLTLGSLIAKIEKLGTQSLSIRSPSSVAAVRGTEFGVDVDGGNSHVGVFDEGHVEVQGTTGAKEMLSPNQETSVARGQAPARAAALSRFAGRREAMRAHVARLETVRRNWKKISPRARRAARARVLRNARQRRLRNLKKRGPVPSDRERRREVPRRQPRRAPKKKAKKPAKREP